MKKIELTKGKSALVDDADYEWLNQYKWSASGSNSQTTYYASRSKPKSGGATTMHRLILGLTDPKVLVDHKDHNGLNNQRSNIRPCTPSQNSKNRIPKGKSKFIGVSLHEINQTYLRKKDGKTSTYHTSAWFASIKVGDKQKSLGLFKTEIEAAIIYNIAARKYHGEFANPNKFANNYKLKDYERKRNIKSDK